MPSITNPKQVVLVTSRSHMNILGKDIEKDNIIAIAWHMQVSFEPHLYAVAVGKTRFSCELIQKSKAFVVNFVPKALEKEAVFCGSHSGKHMDKFKESGLTKEDAQNLDCPAISEAVGYLECEVVNEVEAGDHIIFIGNVINSKLKKDEKRLLQSSIGFTTSVD